MKFRLFASILSALALTACMTVDDDVAPRPSRYWKAPKEALPAENLNPEQIKTNEIIDKAKVIPASDKMAAGELLSLPDLLDIALENNSKTRQYWFQAKSYAAIHGASYARYMPNLTMDLSVYRSKSRNAGLGGMPAMGSYYETGYGPTFELTWLIYDFGKREAQVAEAKENLLAANFDYNQVVQDVALSVNVAYYELYEAMGAVKASQASLDDSAVAYKSSKARYDEQVGKKQDMLLALANLRNAEYALEKDKAYEEDRRANLAKVMGIRVNALLRISDEVNLPTSKEAKQKIDELMSDALKTRQVILSAYATMRAYEQAETVARRNYLPSIGAMASATWTDYTDDTIPGAPAYRYMGGIGLSWDIFEGFTRQYEIISVNAQKRAQAQKLKETEISIISDVWTNYYYYTSALKQVESTKVAVEANLEAFEAVKVGYENGVNSLNDFLTAQSNLATARQQEVSAKALLSSSVAKLAHATGALLINTEADEDLLSMNALIRDEKK